MATESTQGLVDILMLDTSAADSMSSIIFPAFILLIIIFAFFLLIGYHNQPARSLRRGLLKRKMTPRQTAHRLAHSIQMNEAQTAELNKLRFSRTQPTATQVLQLLQQIQS